MVHVLPIVGESEGAVGRRCDSNVSMEVHQMIAHARSLRMLVPQSQDCEIFTSEKGYLLIANLEDQRCQRLFTSASTASGCCPE